MATPGPQQPDATDVDHVIAHPGRQLEPVGMSSSSSQQPTQSEDRNPDMTLGHEVGEDQIHNSSHDGQYAQSVEGAQSSISGHEHYGADLDNRPGVTPPNNPDVELSSARQSSSVERSSPLPEHNAISSPGPTSFDATGTVAVPSGFMFPRLDRRNLGLGGKRKEAHHIVPHDSDLPANVSSGQTKHSHSNSGQAPASSSPVSMAMNDDTVHSASGKTAPPGSDGILADSQMSSQSMFHEQGPQKDHAQYQVDEQIMREASMSDGFERELSSEARSDDVVCVGGNSLTANTSERVNVPRETRYAQTSQPAVRPMVSSRQSAFADPVRNTTARRTFLPSHKPTPERGLNSTAALHQPRVQASPGPARRRVTAPSSPPDETQDLLDVVAYKFKEKEQSLQRAFSADQRKMQSELQKAYHENETLRSQVATFEEQCHQSEVAISKYRSQIGKAKGLQKFLDGLGNDLHSLKRSYDIAKVDFAVRIEASETEIERLECSLAGKDEFETMLSHSKVTLEKLLDAKGFELQSVIQHRDMLRGQLDERIGQLVEERDTRMRLEQLVGQLRLDGRQSLTASLERVTASLVSKMSGLGQQGDELAIEIADIHQSVGTLVARRPATLDDCKALKTEMHELGLRIAQGLSIEAATNTTVADLTTSVEGLIQNHMRTLRQELERIETGWKRTASNEQAHAAVQAQLHGANERLARLESQLNAAREKESSANNALEKSLARVSELEAVALNRPTPTNEGVTPQDVELKVKEAVLAAQKQLSDNANAFIAQEKARYSNELKKIRSEHRKAVEKADAQAEELAQLHSELGRLRNAGNTKTSETVRQLEDLRSRHKVLEHRYQAAQLEASGKAVVESRLTTTIAELDAAKLKVTRYEKEAVSLTQEIKECKTALLQSRNAGEHLKSQLEELQTQSDACNNDLRRQLSQVEGKARYAEAGLDQMRSSAEKTISDEQEKHRKQREALQKRLDEAQSELQMKTAEADDTQAFVERTVRHQQEAWEKSYADLESKVSEHKSSLELTSKRLSDVQTERDTIQTQLAQLQAELQQQQESNTHRWARETTNLGIIDDLRKQHDAAQKEIANLQAIKNQHDRLVDEYEARENTSKDFLNELRKECDLARSQIATLQAGERQRASDDHARGARENELQRKVDDLQNECNTANAALMALRAREARESDLQRKVDDLQNERDTANAALRTLRAREARESDLQHKVDDLQDERDTANTALKALRAASDHRQNNDKAISKPALQLASDNTVPPKVSQYLAPVKQHRKADRNTNTIVTETLRNEPQPTNRAMRARTPVFTSAPTTLAGNSDQNISTRYYEKSSSSHQKDRLPSTSAFLGHHELLNSTINPAVAVEGSDTRFSGSSLQRNSTLDEAGFPKIAPRSSQAFAIPLDFSGNPRVSEVRSFADNAPSAIPSQVSQHSSGFQIYEDSQPLVSDGHFEDESVRANFTFRKPFPPSNSASKRITRRTSDKSLEGRAAPSRGTQQRQPDNTVAPVPSQSDKTPETSKYPFGSSPEFMNPPSTKVKRQYSGSSRPGSSGQAIIRPPSSPMPDPRLVARSGAAKRSALQDSQHTVEEPPTKRRANPAATQTVRRRTTDEGPTARSSQSVKDLPRVEDMNTGRNTGKSQSSHMRSSAVSTRTTRNQAKASKDDAYKARFRQELG